MAHLFSLLLQYVASILQSYPSPATLTTLTLVVTVHFTVPDGISLAAALTFGDWTAIADALCRTFRTLKTLRLEIACCPRQGLLDVQKVVETIPDTFSRLAE